MEGDEFEEERMVISDLVRLSLLLGSSGCIGEILLLLVCVLLLLCLDV
jgi:hypothetical protein